MGLFDFFTKRKKQTDYPTWLDNGMYGTPKWASNKDEQYVRYGYNQIGWIYAWNIFIIMIPYMDFIRRCFQ